MKKTCFVIIGFGVKTDFESGRRINLDKTYENLIKPVFDELNILCFRSCDLDQSGVIDVVMYENILKADFVVADISTLNPNAIYELGVRHALRPNTTVVIAENKLKLPFDVNHVLIHLYEHLETDIGYTEVVRFQKHLKQIITTFMDNPKVDSPVYTFLSNLKPPSFSANEIEEIKESVGKSNSSSDLVELAEQKKNEGNFEMAKMLLMEILKNKPNDSFIVQRLALTTYKSKQPSEEQALKDALDILQALNPKTTTDPETLGLLGAIHKRWYDLGQSKEHLNASLHFYERGFYVKQDYYNGINTAYLYALKASQADKKFDIYSNYGQARKIWNEIIEKWSKIAKEANFSDRGDIEWVYLTLAEAHFGLGDIPKEQEYVKLVKNMPNSEFAIGSYSNQHSHLLEVKSKIKIEAGEEL